MLRSLKNSKGFTLIEIAVVMIIIGLLAGGGVSLMRMLSQRKMRQESIAYLNQAKDALVSFASINGRLPWADTSGNGNENTGATAGNLPFLTLKMPAADSYRRALKYELNPGLGNNLSASCTALRSGLAGDPDIVDADGSSTAFAVAALVVSAGPTDADGNGNVFDDINSGTHQGDNTDGNPNYLRHPPIDTTFDDLVSFIGENELYAKICEYLALAVNNNSGVNVYVRNLTLGVDLGGPLADGNSGLYYIQSGTQIALRDAGGSAINSNPPTPIFLAGQGYTLNAIP